MCVNTGCSSCSGNCGCTCSACCSNDCNSCTSDPCNEQPCGCKFEVPFACVRYTGNELTCIDFKEGETLEQFAKKVNDILCGLSEGVDGDDGDSAYQIWLNLGNVGDEAAFIASLEGAPGDDGVGITNIAWTSNGAGQPQGTAGTTDTYTITLTDASTYDLLVTNGADGADAIDLYDSGWVTIQDYDAGEGFGLPAFVNHTQPQIRVIGKHAYVRGFFMIPMGAKGAPATLVADVDTYPDANKAEVDVFTGTAGGLSPDASGTLTSVQPILPAVLRPAAEANIANYEIVTRPVLDNGDGTHNLNLMTILQRIDLKTDGRVYMSTMKKISGVAGALLSIKNLPSSMFVMKVDAGEQVTDYKVYKQQFKDSAPSAYSADIVELGAGYTDGTHTGVTSTSTIGGGAGAQFTVVISGGKVVEATVTTAGSGYKNGEIVELDDTSGVPGVGTPSSKAYIRISTDNRVSLPVVNEYPCTFDGENEEHLGGFLLPFTFNYPIDESATEAQIEAAINSML